MTPEQMQEMAKTLGPLVAAQLVEQSKGHRDSYVSLLDSTAAAPAPEEPRRAPITGKHMTDACSGRSRSLSPEQAEHRLRGKPNTDSGASRTPVAG